MVTILSVAFTPPTGMTHERTTSPLKCTEQAPHCAMPHPYFVPVRPTCSRITHSNGVVGSTSMLCDCPLMVRATICPPAHPPVSFPCRQLARERLLCWRDFCKRASMQSLTILNKARHRNSVNRHGCRRWAKVLWTRFVYNLLFTPTSRVPSARDTNTLEGDRGGCTEDLP